jgi:hypothetical protein
MLPLGEQANLVILLERRLILELKILLREKLLNMLKQLVLKVLAYMKAQITLFISTPEQQKHSGMDINNLLALLLVAVVLL